MITINAAKARQHKNDATIQNLTWQELGWDVPPASPPKEIEALDLPVQGTVIMDLISSYQPKGKSIRIDTYLDREFGIVELNIVG